MVIYIFLAQPMETKEKNNREAFDECIINFLLIHMFCMTDFVPDAYARSLVGYSFCALFTGFLAFNIVQMIIQSIKSIRLLVARCK